PAPQRLSMVSRPPAASAAAGLLMPKELTMADADPSVRVGPTTRHRVYHFLFVGSFATCGSVGRTHRLSPPPRQPPDNDGELLVCTRGPVAQSKAGLPPSCDSTQAVLAGGFLIRFSFLR